MSQKLTITIDGENGQVLPDSVGEILRAVFALLRSMDVRSWPVNAPRIRWRVSEAKLVNPLTVEAQAESIILHDGGGDDLALGLVAGLQDIQKGVWPISFNETEMKFAKTIGAEAKRSRRLTICGSYNGSEKSFDVPRNFKSRVAKLIREPKTIREEYASIEGVLFQMVNDPLRVDGSAKIRERNSGNEVICHADPRRAAELAKYLNREANVVLYGIVRYENDLPKRIDVEDYAELPAMGSLPTLADLHAMKLSPPNDQSIEDFVDGLRGDE